MNGHTLREKPLVEENTESNLVNSQIYSPTSQSDSLPLERSVELNRGQKKLPKLVLDEMDDSSMQVTGSCSVLLVSNDPILTTQQVGLIQKEGIRVLVEKDVSRVSDILDRCVPQLLILDLLTITTGISESTDTSEDRVLLNKISNSEQTSVLLLASETDLCTPQLTELISWECLLIKPVRSTTLIPAIKNLVQRNKKLSFSENATNEFFGEKDHELKALNQHATVSVTDANGKITYANEKFCKSCGYRLDELIGQTHRMIKSDMHSPAFYQDMWLTINAGKVWTGDICNRSKDGKLYWVASTIVPFLRGSGKPYQFVSIRTDITETKQRQLESKRSSQTKSEFLANMSHELRTPLNAILGFAQVLENDEELNEDQLDSVDEICKAGRHLLNLINDVLHLSKIESGHVELSVEPIKLSELVSECCDLVALAAHKTGITIQLAEVDDHWVKADRTRLKQVLLNLLSNAVKYNAKEGTVSLFVDPMNEQTLRITVGDSGPGISPEKQDQLFQPFNRLGAEHSEIEGTGIGLSIARRLVEMMGGKIGVDSFEGIGSCFWMELPRIVANHPSDGFVTDDGVTNDSLTSHHKKYKVLYIEDNLANLKLVSQVLSKRQYIELITAQEPEKGLELATAHQPELILLDINMPRLDGYQVLSLLNSNQQLKDIPVVAVTASAMQQDIEKGQKAGFTDYLTKPFDVSSFLGLVDRLLEQRHSA